MTWGWASALIAVLSLASVALAADSPPEHHFYRANLVRFEGIKSKPYRDAGNGWTVGIGHSITANHEAIKPRYTDEEIDAFYHRDLANALRAARLLVVDFDTLPNPAKEVVIHLIFQCGPTGFSRFKNLRFALSRRAFNASAAELWDSRWFRQTPAPRANWALRSLISL